MRVMRQLVEHWGTITRSAAQWTFYALWWLVTVGYLVTMLGLQQWASPETTRRVHEYFQMFICAFLIIRFRPSWMRWDASTRSAAAVLSPLDREIVFSAGMMLLTSSLLGGQLPPLPP